METRLLSPKAVCDRTSLSRSTLDRLVAARTFPQPVRITDRRLAFNAASIEAWMQEQLEREAA